MRPTDENQDGSTRPNLLSGGRRRIPDDSNILARLERDSVRQALGNRSRAAWHVAAAALVLLLVLFVAWIAYQNTGTALVAPTPRTPVDMGPASATIVTPASPWSLPSPPAPQQVTNGTPHMVPLPAQDPQVHDHSHPLPPLVLLERPSSVTKPPGSLIAPIEPGRSAKPTIAPVKATASEPTRGVPPVSVTMARSTPRLSATPRPRKNAADDAPDSLVDTMLPCSRQSSSTTAPMPTKRRNSTRQPPAPARSNGVVHAKHRRILEKPMNRRHRASGLGKLR